MNDRRKARMLRELVGDEHDVMPDADRFVRIVSILVLVLFVVVFSGTYPG
jgi:hypothetical protein